MKKLLLLPLTLMLVIMGAAAFSANTAQWVNVEARVEKEIELACVISDSVSGRYIVDPDGCDFGVTFPQNIHEKVVELTLSNSFYKQDLKSDVLYWVLWECKQFDDGRDLNGDGIPDCRVDVPWGQHVITYSTTEGTWVHGDQELDGMIRDHIVVSASAPSCLATYNGPTYTMKHIEGIGNGVVDRDAQPKCFYHLAYTPPVCEGHYNPYTDPATVPGVIKCHEMTDDPDPQNWDRFADLGDDFKIQVYGFSFH